MSRSDLALPEHFQHQWIIRGIHHRQYRFVILGGGAEHGGAADVDVLQGVFQRGVLIGNGELKGIEIHRHQVDRDDLMPLERRHVFGQIAAGEERAVDHGVQRLDPSVQQLGKPGQLLHLDDGDVARAERGGGSAGRDDLPAQVGQTPGKGHNAAFIADGDEGAGHGQSVASRQSPVAQSPEPVDPRLAAGDSRLVTPFKPTTRPARAAASTTAGSSRCSCWSTRSASRSGVSPGRTGTRACASVAP